MVFKHWTFNDCAAAFGTLTECVFLAETRPAKETDLGWLSEWKEQSDPSTTAARPKKLDAPDKKSKKDQVSTDVDKSSSNDGQDPEGDASDIKSVLSTASTKSSSYWKQKRLELEKKRNALVKLVRETETRDEEAEEDCLSPKDFSSARNEEGEGSDERDDCLRGALSDESRKGVRLPRREDTTRRLVTESPTLEIDTAVLRKKPIEQLDAQAWYLKEEEKSIAREERDDEVEAELSSTRLLIQQLKADAELDSQAWHVFK